jgi:hypothetical protein
MACSYSTILGDVKQGIHSYRVFDVAIVDVLGTLLIAYLISKKHFVITAILLFILGIALHRIFCVRTTIDKLLF